MNPDRISCSKASCSGIRIGSLNADAWISETFPGRDQTQKLSATAKPRPVQHLVSL
jgi:hypothetical protein